MHTYSGNETDTSNKNDNNLLRQKLEIKKVNTSRIK